MQASQAYEEDSVAKESIVQLQTYMGFAWSIGSLSFGIILIAQSSECRIARQYLTQASLILTGLSIFALTAVKGSYSGYVMFSWIYGVFNGGYAYSLKMYIYEKVRARNFARAWAFAQMAMGLPIAIGLPTVAYMSEQNVNFGYYFSATCVIIGGICLSFVDVHKKRLRKKRRLRQCKSTASTATAATIGTTFNSTTGTIHRHLYSSNSQNIDTPRGSYVMREIPSSPVPAYKFQYINPESPVDTVIKAEDILANSLGLVDEPVTPQPKLILVRSHSDAEMLGGGSTKMKKLMSLDLIEQGDHDHDALAELDEEDDDILYGEVLDDDDEDEDEVVFNDDIDYLEGITSCNKVENCIILSEFEQNCLQENDQQQPLRVRGPRMGVPKNNKKWFKKQQRHSGHQNNTTNNPEVLVNKSKKWSHVLPGPSKEMATVIEENSSSAV